MRVCVPWLLFTPFQQFCMSKALFETIYVGAVVVATAVVGGDATAATPIGRHFCWLCQKLRRVWECRLQYSKSTWNKDNFSFVRAQIVGVGEIIIEARSK